MLTSNPGVSSILGSATGQGLPLVTYKILFFFFFPPSKMNWMNGLKLRVVF